MKSSCKRFIWIGSATMGALVLVLLATAVLGPLVSAEQGGPATYRVRAGDTLSAIAMRSGVPVFAIVHANGLSNAQIYPGQSLIIPPQRVVRARVPAVSTSCPGPTAYVIRWGDTLIGISERFGVNVDALMRANNLQEDFIVMGQVLRIPCPPPVDQESGPTPSADEVPSACGPWVVVQAGDTLAGIAARCRTSAAELKEHNRLISDILFVGQTLQLPPGAVTSPEPSES